MSNQTPVSHESEYWIVVNDQTGSHISKPCPRDIAEQIKEWIEDYNPHGYTYTIIEAPEGEPE